MRCLLLACSLCGVGAFRVSALHPDRRPVAAPSRSAAPQLNLFGDILGGGDRLKAQKEPDRPLLPKLVGGSAASYVLQEKLLSMSGEDFVVRDIAGNVVIQIEGFNVNLGGFVLDKLGFKDAGGAKFMSVERRALATTTCYDIYDPSGTCVAKVDREMFSLTPTYKCVPGPWPNGVVAPVV